MLIDLPSKDIIELVIEVINDENTIKENVIIGIYPLIVLLSKKGFTFISDSIILSYFKHIPIHATICNTNPNPELIINTGVAKKRFNSFLINDIDFLFVKILYSLFLLEVITFLLIELIL